MKKTLINQIQMEMSGVLNNAQRQKLCDVLEHCFFNLDIVALDSQALNHGKDNVTLKEEFLSAKQIEGCSLRSISYYGSTLDNLIKNLQKPFNQVETEDLRVYLSEYQKRNNASKQTIDNIRRILSSFFTWLEDEDYILKSPVISLTDVFARANYATNILFLPVIARDNFVMSNVSVLITHSFHKRYFYANGAAGFCLRPVKPMRHGARLTRMSRHASLFGLDILVWQKTCYHRASDFNLCFVDFNIIYFQINFIKLIV